MIEGVTPNGEDWLEGGKLEEFMKKYEHPLWKKMGELAKKGGGHGGMDWLMVWRMVDCLHRGEPLDQDVYDAAAWSSVGPLEREIDRRAKPVGRRARLHPRDAGSRSSPWQSWDETVKPTDLRLCEATFSTQVVPYRTP